MVVTPAEVAADHAGLLFGRDVVGAVEGAVAQRLELRRDPGVQGIERAQVPGEGRKVVRFLLACSRQGCRSQPQRVLPANARRRGARQRRRLPRDLLLFRWVIMRRGLCLVGTRTASRSKCGLNP